MASLMVDFIISLDGYASADGWPGLWGMDVPEYLAFVEEGVENEHVALMGATTYRLMSGFATEMPDDPGVAALTALPKVVYSSTLEAPLSWPNTELVDGDAVEAVKEMKRSDPRLYAPSAASACAGRCCVPASWTASVWSSSRSSPAPPGRSASSTGIPTSPSSWSRAARSTVGSSCSSTSQPCSMGRPASATSRSNRERNGDHEADDHHDDHRRRSDAGARRAGRGPQRADSSEADGHAVDDERPVSFLSETQPRTRVGPADLEIFAGSWGTWDDPGDSPIWTA